MLSDIDRSILGKITGYCLNPCSNGICSLTLTLKYMIMIVNLVLILVLMEYAL